MLEARFLSHAEHSCGFWCGVFLLSFPMCMGTSLTALAEAGGLWEPCGPRRRQLDKHTSEDAAGVSWLGGTDLPSLLSALSPQAPELHSFPLFRRPCRETTDMDGQSQECTDLKLNYSCRHTLFQHTPSSSMNSGPSCAQGTEL